MTRYSFVLGATAAALLAAPAVLADGPFNLGTSPQVPHFWIVSLAPLLSTRLDPIVSPGGVSGHNHAVVGGSAFGPSYGYEATRASKCTTANVDIDRSNYWVPQLYRKQSNGTVELVPLSYVNAYYQTRRTGEEPVYEFPPGFRMLAGDASRHTFDETDPRQAAVSYVCLGNGGPQTNKFPEKNCPSGLRAQVYFPHCWDGVNNWLEGSAHVSYGEGKYDGGGQCPPTHPKRIMGLFYEFIFKDDYPYVPGARVWANGDDAGYAFHGDFANGWPLGFFKQIFDEGENCAVGFGLENCKPLVPHLANNGSGCAPEGVVVDEDTGVNGVAKLPGNNPFWGLSGAKKPDPDYVEKAVFRSITPPMPSNWAKVGCIDEPDNGRGLTGEREVFEDDMTPEKCMAFCASKGFNLAGIEYSSECYCDNSLRNGATEAPSAKGCGLSCSGLPLSQGACGGRRTLTLYKFTGTGHPSVGDLVGGAQFQPSPSAVNSVAAEGVCAFSKKGDPVFSTKFTTCTAAANLGPVPTPAGGPLNFPTGTGGSMPARVQSSAIGMATGTATKTKAMMAAESMPTATKPPGVVLAQQPNPTGAAIVEDEEEEEEPACLRKRSRVMKPLYKQEIPL